MTQSLDWIVKNWDFLSSRRVVEIPTIRFKKVFNRSDLPTSGKFFGTQGFIDSVSVADFVAETRTGGYRVALRPFINAPMPNPEVQAVYIDPKRYKFDEQGFITGLDDCYELPIVVFKI